MNYAIRQNSLTVFSIFLPSTGAFDLEVYINKYDEASTSFYKPSISVEDIGSVGNYTWDTNHYKLDLDAFNQTFIFGIEEGVYRIDVVELGGNTYSHIFVSHLQFTNCLLAKVKSIICCSPTKSCHELVSTNFPYDFSIISTLGISFIADMKNELWLDYGNKNAAKAEILIAGRVYYCATAGTADFTGQLMDTDGQLVVNPQQGKLYYCIASGVPVDYDTAVLTLLTPELSNKLHRIAYVLSKANRYCDDCNNDNQCNC
jgi:hypothetical protein